MPPEYFSYGIARNELRSRFKRENGVCPNVHFPNNITRLEALINGVKRLENLLGFKAKLKEAFQEIRQIKRGEIQGIRLSELIDEL